MWPLRSSKCFWEGRMVVKFCCHMFFFFPPWYLYYRRLRCYGVLQIRNSEKMQDCGFGAFVTLLMLERADKMLMKCRTSLAKIRSTHSLNFSQIRLDGSIIYPYMTAFQVTFPISCLLRCNMYFLVSASYSRCATFPARVLWLDHRSTVKPAKRNLGIIGNLPSDENFGSLRFRRGTLLVAQLVQALRYKPEGHGFDSRWCQWNFSLTQSFRPHYGPGVDSASNKNEYQQFFLGLKAVGA